MFLFLEPGCPIPMDGNNANHDYPDGGPVPVPVGEAVKYSCAPGHMMDGGAISKTINCLNDGSYSGDPADCSK